MMKYTTLCVALLCALFIVPIAHAALTASDVSLSLDDAVERSNPIPERSDNALDDNSELSYVTFNIPVSATGQTEQVTGVTPNLGSFSYDSFSGEVNSSARYRIDTPLPLSVPAGTTQNVVVRVLVPSNLDAIDSSYNDIQHTLTASLATTDGAKTVNLAFYAENNLQLKKVTLKSGSDTYKCSVDEGDETLDCDNDIRELDKQDFTLDFTMENRFNSDSEVDFQGVDLSIDSDNGDVDPSDDSFDEDIDADDSVSESVNFEVDDSLDDGDDAEITIEASVDDDNGAKHGFSHKFKVEFNAQDYELALPSVSLSPNQVCPGENTVLTYSLQNLGSKRQPNVRPVLISDALNLNKVLPTVDLKDSDSSGDSFRGTATVTVPSSVRPGSYPVQLQVYYKDEDSQDALQTQSATLNVQTCENGVPVRTGSSGSNSGTTTSNGSGQSGNVVVVQPGQSGSGTQTAPTTSTNVPVRAVVAESSDTPFLVGLGVAVLVLVIVVGLLIAAVVRK